MVDWNILKRGRSNRIAAKIAAARTCASLALPPKAERSGIKGLTTL
jgi:hypothetical protein